MSQAEHTHVAFSDESHHNVGRFRSVGLVTLSDDQRYSMEHAVSSILQRHQMTELKCGEVKDRRRCGAAKEVVELVLAEAEKGNLRIDVLMWDTEDARHKVVGRDDTENLARMYHHLYRAVLRRRWPDDSSWRLYPDENTAIDWNNVETFLEWKSIVEEDGLPLLGMDDWWTLARRTYSIVGIEEVESHRQPLAQVADLFAGMCVKARQGFDKYMAWRADNPSQPLLFSSGDGGVRVSNREKSQFEVIRHLRRISHQKKLGVSLKSSKGLRTPQPCNPINFWWWESQHAEDKAPTRDGIRDMWLDGGTR